MEQRWAYVTLATNDSYGLGAQVLGYSLRETGTSHPLICLVTNHVTSSSRERLESVFDRVVCVEELNSFDQTRLSLLGRKDLGITFTKLHVWNLLEYERVVFLDADCLVLKSIDELFDSIHDLDETWIAAAPDIGWPDCFNSGMFVCRPSTSVFQRLLIQSLAQGSFDGGDQGLLNMVFEGRWKRVPFTYNTCPGTVYSYAPAYRYYESRIKMIHFLGNAENKPWNWTRTSDGTFIREPQVPNEYRDLVYKWWHIYDRHTTLSRTTTDSSRPTQQIPSDSQDTIAPPLHTVPSNESLRDRYNWTGLFDQSKSTDATSPSATMTTTEIEPSDSSRHTRIASAPEFKPTTTTSSSQSPGSPRDPTSKVRQLTSQFETLHRSSVESPSSSPRSKTRDTSTESPPPASRSPFSPRYRAP
jgi:glycogenin